MEEIAVRRHEAFPDFHASITDSEDGDTTSSAAPSDCGWPRSELTEMFRDGLTGLESFKPDVSYLPSPLPTPPAPAVLKFPELPLHAEPHANHHESAMPDPSASFVSSPETSTENTSTEETSSESAMSSLGAERIPHEGEPVEGDAPRSRSRSGTKSSTGTHDGVRRLSASKIQELTAAPESLPVASIPNRQPSEYPLSAGYAETSGRLSMTEKLQSLQQNSPDHTGPLRSDGSTARVATSGRPNLASRTVSTPPTSRRKSSSQYPSQSLPTRRNSYNPLAHRPPPLDLDGRTNAPSAGSKPASNGRAEPADPPPPPSPIPTAIPLPPMSIPTILQLELSTGRPSPLYIHHSHALDQPYESSAVKFERLKNVLLLPTYLERTMNFGALACLDAWLWTFTILPMRFCVALGVLVQWWGYLILKEAKWVVGFVWYGLGRMWKRQGRGRPMSRTASYGSTISSATDESRSRSRVRDPSASLPNGSASYASGMDVSAPAPRRMENLRSTSSVSANGGLHVPKKPMLRPQQSTFRHRRTKSTPSNLTSFHKADLLQGLVIIFSSVFLMNLDASRMYHFIRAQSAMKLYVIYNVLEVGDRLLSALGQDIFECLFSSETLSRNSSGRSKVLLPFFMFLLSLVYNTFHSVTLFYQVTTLNVAVNSYSNALLTLLISNQFVEIKSSVFKRFEKENTFQLTCADIVERFQLWIMLLIIGMRNVVEVGGLSVPGAGNGDATSSSLPLHTASILPDSFTLLPSWLLSGEVLSPFLIVIGSEMVVDWIKHAYINKFNNIKPNFYGRILDILCKDYYTNAFVTPSLTRRLGLPLLPLSCLFIRASVQTYHMFLATHLPTPIAPSTGTSLSVDNSSPTSTSPAVLAALEKLDSTIRSALGRAVYGYPYSEDPTGNTTAGVGILTFWRRWTSDDAIAAVTMVVVFLLIFLALLVVKLLLGMVLLRYARDRYARMKAKEAAVASGKADRDVYDSKGKRLGGYGHIEVGEDRKRWVYGDDVEGLRKSRERERKAADSSGKEKDLSGVMRYEMIAKRIW